MIFSQKSMTHFGIICPSASGHLNPMCTIGYELKRRGHRVTIIGMADARNKTLETGLEFKPVALKEFSEAKIAEYYAESGKMSKFAAFRHTIQFFQKTASIMLRELPSVIKDIGVEILIVDQTFPWVITIAEYLDIYFITICCALMINRDILVPPFYTPWQYNPSWLCCLRNQMGYKILDYLTQPIQDSIDEYRQKWKLAKFPLSYTFHPQELAQLTQQPAEFEFPRSSLHAVFHFTGPFHSQASRKPVAFPWDKLNGKPLIYASMGTLQNRLISVFEKIAAACQNLDAQLVISLGGSAKPESLPKLAGNPILVEYAPQLELLQKATLVITHAGLNTALESLSNGVPMIAIPVTNDQPAVAARIVWSGTGEAIPVDKLTVEKLQKCVNKVLTDDSYKRNAMRLQEAIASAGGVSRAADIIEEAVFTKKPVLAR
uniref:CylN n=1 Tax=Cylindrospermum licheniforme UTEX B 2014 TaxID=379530 RepID=A0A1Y0K742_9NOST|nr:CylN [Cylindrospermum licheniforme UTEX B 2014]